MRSITPGLGALLISFLLKAPARALAADATLPVQKPTNNWTPAVFTSNTPQEASDIEHIDSKRFIEGLLEIRNPADAKVVPRQSCPSGWGSCKDGGCCPLGGGCCGNRRCCGTGNFCYTTTVCCPRSYGGCDQRGCCPSGWNCCRGGACCAPGRYCAISSSGQQGCCPDGEICSGGGGVQTIVGGGGNNPPPTTHKTTAIKTTTVRHTTESTGSITSTNPLFPPLPTSAPNIQPPSPSPGTRNQWVDLNTPSITWYGIWDFIPHGLGNCNSTAPAKKCGGSDASSSDLVGSSNHSIKFSLTGSSISFSLASVNAWYIVTVNTQEFEFGGPNHAAPDNCSWVVNYVTGSGKDEELTIDVDVKGFVEGPTVKRSPMLELYGDSHEMERRSDTDWWFEINGVVIQTLPASPSTTAGPNAALSSSSPGFVVNALAAVGICVIWICLRH